MSLPREDGRALVAANGRCVRWGDTVQAHYMAWKEDGTLIDTSMYGEPIVFTPGQHAVLEGLENLAIGMTVGESRTEKLSPELAFGLYRADLNCEVSYQWMLAHHVVPKVGLELDLQQADGTTVSMVISDVTGERVTLDANHRLAGQALILQLEILAILSSAESGPSAPTLMDW